MLENKVFIVFYKEFANETEEIIAIFSTPKLAKDYVKNHNPDTYNKAHDDTNFSIVEFCIDEQYYLEQTKKRPQNGQQSIPRAV